MNLLQVLARTGRLWWQHWISLLGLNVLWFFLHIPIITAPGATATFYIITKKMVDDEAWDYQDVWETFKANLWRSWGWGSTTLLLILVIAGNFSAYAEFEGTVWTLLRLLWGLIAAVAFVLNLFFWPFWLVQEDKSLKTTFRNSGLFAIRHPLATLIIALLCGIILYLSIQLIVPMTIGAIGLVVLIGIVAVDGRS